MSGRQRLAMLGVAAAIAIAAVLVLQGGDEDESPPPEPVARTQTAVTETTPKPKPKPKPPLLTAGRERTLSVKKGEAVAFRVRSKSAEEVHVHGYDILRPVPAGRTVTVRFPAKLDGVYEIELERSKTHVAKLEVTP